MTNLLLNQIRNDDKWHLSSNQSSLDEKKHLCINQLIESFLLTRLEVEEMVGRLRLILLFLILGFISKGHSFIPHPFLAYGALTSDSKKEISSYSREFH
jgi:hypothetical protein